MNSHQSSSRERIAEERQKLNQMCIQLYLAAQEKEMRAIWRASSAGWKWRRLN